MADFLPPLPDNFEPTRATLHAYAHAVGAIPAPMPTHTTSGGM